MSDRENSGGDTGINTRSAVSVGAIDPVNILHQAFAKMTAVGSATAMVAVKIGNDLRVANIGDSGFI